MYTLPYALTHASTTLPAGAVQQVLRRAKGGEGSLMVQQPLCWTSPMPCRMHTSAAKMLILAEEVCMRPDISVIMQLHGIHAPSRLM